MKLTINTDVLSKNNITLGEFIIMLMGFYNIEFTENLESAVSKGIAEKNLFTSSGAPPVLSDNNKNLVVKILTESNDKAINSNIDFEKVAQSIMSCYPHGKKTGTTYDWQGTKEEIAQKLRTLVVEHDFTFTEKEAIEATKEYVSNFKPPFVYMQLLKYFLLRTKNDGHGHKEMSSEFMSIIENNRDNKNETDN